MLEAVLLPELELCFCCSDPEQGRPGLEIHFGREISKSTDKQEEKSIRDRLRAQATARLKQAKQLHDELEAIYRPYMDFEGLNALGESLIAGLVGPG